MAGAQGTPSDASVYIDEQYIGPLYYVAARGVRMPIGEHRITVTREGYFDWDTIVVADRDPIALNVALVPVPD
ncbi:MAG: PEGA domain-containing protein [Polyangiaceae bacterium]|nr:PEGA domain-containing protein [Polyangiaceae bacterium]